jgi:hypothetical protein
MAGETLFRSIWETRLSLTPAFSATSLRVSERLSRTARILSPNQYFIAPFFIYTKGAEIYIQKIGAVNSL